MDVDLDAVYAQNVVEVGPKLKYPAHGDAIGSVAFHPLRPVLLSTSGSRHFDDSAMSSSSSESSDEGQEKEEQKVVTRARTRPHPVAFDASVKLWSYDQGAEALTTYIH